MINLGLLIIRLIVGLSFAGHGAQKLFGWFGGHGPKATGGAFDSMGIKPGFPMAVLAGLAELIGGLLFAIGLFTWLGAALIIITMLVAILKVHGKNGYYSEGGFEFQLILIAVALGVGMIGPGAYAIG
ncbi:DoxX family protein [Tuberibacillus sp. Marseille-P3662]|uniref:DoxX family protein n=1 Tax=Tuberibacillus sp. Marseille-P3662 TaxID=1965358 RepID=UPI000A1CE8A8|nr:DoxX family protein [Tuberibacillus sp. Marseille-P3662]